ncbi:hypothetical protein NTG1052_230009 [Candidatus Nitrotoga sp. 1052]|uniref:hypothetical protein n=1 Tax=Candidatus Nitrotoga sp. 1052 TaxID=2886964 RepID=UPI001EF6DDEE|nr:hypothetical protein [Candidatus Nitrotoga sp. 1052]CAH1074673.1 hypothetical protein NTG1052_230009 [Candidatus Nitrotoga sp. 1052]
MNCVPVIAASDTNTVVVASKCSFSGARRREFTAKTSGELFRYVNDAVLLWPGKINLFYGNNSDTGVLTTVERVMPDGQLARLDHQISGRR